MLREGFREQFAMERGVLFQSGPQVGIVGLRACGDVQKLPSAVVVEKGVLHFCVGDFREEAHIFLIRRNSHAHFVEGEMLLRNLGVTGGDGPARAAKTS